MTKEAISHYLRRTGFDTLSPKAVLFDMDGVCYDSMPYHALAWQQSMAHFGLKMTAYDAYASEGAKGTDTIMALARRETGQDITLQQAQAMYDVKSQIFHSLKPLPPIMPGILNLMAQIHSSGLGIGIVTGSGQRPLIARLMRDFQHYVGEEHIVTAYDVQHGKPAPDPYLMGLEKMGALHPWQALVVENAPLGVAAGVASRCFTIAVNTGPLPDEALTKQGADLLFHTMTELSDSWEQLFEGMSSRCACASNPEH